MKKTRSIGNSFYDGKGPHAKECRLPLEAGKDTKQILPLELPEGTHTRLLLDFSPRRSILDYGPLEL